ncbi:MAG: hypothetical protein HY817_02590 [Candidatus Abawacabacteria bacterium]|nr:hypothetical protein [Candidatus Abawacabacteria bacterium]
MIEVEQRYLVKGNSVHEMGRLMKKGWHPPEHTCFVSFLLDQLSGAREHLPIQAKGWNLRMRLSGVGRDFACLVMESRHHLATLLASLKGDEAVSCMLKKPSGNSAGKEEIDEPASIARELQVKKLSGDTVRDLLEALISTGYDIHNLIATERTNFRKVLVATGEMTVAWNTDYCGHQLERPDSPRSIIEVETCLEINPLSTAARRNDLLRAAEEQNNAWVRENIADWPRVPGTAALCVINHMPIDDVRAILKKRGIKAAQVRQALVVGEIDHERLALLQRAEIISVEQYQAIQTMRLEH